jgi:hypothetical protein
VARPHPSADERVTAPQSRRPFAERLGDVREERGSAVTPAAERAACIGPRRQPARPTRRGRAAVLSGRTDQSGQSPQKRVGHDRGHRDRLRAGQAASRNSAMAQSPMHHCLASLPDGRTRRHTTRRPAPMTSTAPLSRSSRDTSRYWQRPSLTFFDHVLAGRHRRDCRSVTSDCGRFRASERHRVDIEKASVAPIA